jgi:WD40 repeat protein
VASGDERGWVHVWQPAATGTPIGKAQFGDQPIRYLASDRAGSVVLLAGEDSTDVWLWHPNQPGTSALKIGPSKQSVAALALSPDGQKLLVAGYDSTVTQYDLSCTKLGMTHLQWIPFQVHFNVKNTGFSALGPDGKAFTYLFGSEKPVLEDLPGNQQTSWTEDGTHYAAFDPMGGTDQPCQINTYTSEGFRVQSFLHRRCMGLTALALRPDGKVLAAAGGDGRVMIWRVLREGEKERR